MSLIIFYGARIVKFETENYDCVIKFHMVKWSLLLLVEDQGLQI